MDRRAQVDYRLHGPVFLFDQGPDSGRIASKGMPIADEDRDGC